MRIQGGVRTVVSVAVVAATLAFVAAAAAESPPRVSPAGEASQGGPAPSRAVAGRSERLPDPGLIDEGAVRDHRRVTTSETRALPAFQDLDLEPEAPGGRAVGAALPPGVLERVAALTDPFSMRGGARPGRGGTARDGRDAPWAPDRLLADATHMNDEYVSLQKCPTSGNLYCVFHATDLGGTDRDIHIARSTDDGATWQVWEMPSFTQDEYQAELAIDAAGYLYVTWIRADGIVVRSRSNGPDNPTTWKWVKGLNTGETHATPTIAVSGSGDFSTVFIAAGWLTINWDLYVYEWTLIWMYSTNGGTTVTYDSFVPDGYQDYWPDAELDGGTCYLVNGEQDYYTGEVEVLLAVDAVSGGFSDPLYLSAWTDMSCGFPIVAAEGDYLYAVFQLDYDDGLGNIDGDVIYCFSWDGGATVYGPYEIVADEYESVGPVVYTEDGIVGCLWLDAPPNGDEFYLAARQAGGHGHPDNWGDVETVTVQNHVEPSFRSDAGAVGEGRLHAAWIDRRDFPTQGLNVYTTERPVLPNLAPFTPSGWGGALVANMVKGRRETGVLAAGDTVYVSFAFWNDGLAGAEEGFLIRLTVDGAQQAAWSLEGGLEAGWYVTVEDHAIVAGPGPHAVGFEVDYEDAVPETDETDNAFAETLEFVDGSPSLRLVPDEVVHVFAEPEVSRAEALAAAARVRLARSVSVPVVEERLARALEADPGARQRVVATAADRVDAAALGVALRGADRDVRREAVAEALREAAAEFRGRLSAVVEPLVAAGAMSEPEGLWLSCSFVAEMDAAAVGALAAHPAVGSLWLDDTRSEPFGGPGGDADARALAWHVTRVGADQAWSQGYDGSGVVVGHLDSGVAYDHPDLAGVMWDGGPSYPHHGWDCLDEDNDPYDGDTDYWHGTHTAGLVAGNGSGGTATGVAPGARIMALRCVPGYQTDVVEALEFALDHGAEVITMSAGWGNASDAVKEANRQAADALLAAGLAWCCAAGNGDNAGGHYAVPHDVSSPADCPNPWYGTAGHSAVIAVGATDVSDGVWSDSSYGPTEWDIATTPGYDDYPYPPGLQKPDVAAPGVNVTSTVPGGYVAYSGTSMATPVAAGAAAILLQASPDAAPSDLAAALEAGAVDVGAAGRDAYSGAGRVDVPAALAALPTTDAESVWVHNDGPVPLIVDDVSWTETWLTAAPAAMAIDPGDSARLVLVFDGAGLPNGLYSDEVLFASNDDASPHSLPVLAVKGAETGVPDDAPGQAARTAALESAPNPFNPRTEVSFTLASGGRARLAVYSADGRLVRTLVAAVLSAGRHAAEWDGLDAAGRPVASGVYFLRLTGPGVAASRKLTLLK